ncbi:AbrB/MazE/SpoVT family DNA-binding domain-containing protein [Aerococcus christensenii]|nr:hypothetical protein [Aerococcus christensenii]MDK8234658.1 AbrB/MazE/SpoVT family DNA-binding domain-containing protein [Aerococcus christensenii]DAP05847.1 MAG TPA: VapB family protein [Caudoviricetes sp.]
MPIKARKVGNSLTLTVPNTLNIPEGALFSVKREGTALVYTPIQTNPFETDELMAYQAAFQQEEWETELLDSEWD